jgi:hypothetical protein
MRDATLSADEALEASFVAMSLYYTSIASTPGASSPETMEDLYVSLLGVVVNNLRTDPLLLTSYDDHSEIPASGSSPFFALSDSLGMLGTFFLHTKSLKGSKMV